MPCFQPSPSAASAAPHSITALHPKENRFNTLAIAYGVGFGIVIGSVVFAITQNPVWIGIGIPFGAALGIVFGEAPEEPAATPRPAGEQGRMKPVLQGLLCSSLLNSTQRCVR